VHTSLSYREQHTLYTTPLLHTCYTHLYLHVNGLEGADGGDEVLQVVPNVGSKAEHLFFGIQ
jgi:hypothetical protein